MLGERGNPTLVGRCTTSLGVILTCPVVQNTLVIADSVYLQGIQIRIRTCNSSLWPVFIYSNMTQPVDNIADYLQCPRMINLGELMLKFDVMVFNTTTFVVIRTSVSLHNRSVMQKFDDLVYASLILSRYKFGDHQVMLCCLAAQIFACPVRFLPVKIVEVDQN